MDGKIRPRCGTKTTRARCFEGLYLALYACVKAERARARTHSLPPPPLHPTHHCARYARNEPFSSCLKPLFQSEAKSEALDMKMNFYSQGHKTHFPHNKGFALSLTLTVSVWNSAMANWWRSF